MAMDAVSRSSLPAKGASVHYVFMLRRVGYFHFAQAHCDPLGELTKAIAAVTPTELPDSLIVLPEAFNLGRDYDPNPTPKERPLLNEQSVLGRLHDVAVNQQLLFVVSVIEVEARRNSAYLIGAGTPRLMCHKIMDDQSQEYERCTSNCDIENPVRLSDDTCIGALICADVMDNRRQPSQEDAAQAAFDRLTTLRSNLNGKRNLVCVPAYMATTGKDPAFPDCGLILANSRADSRSFIKDNTGAKIKTSAGAQNHIQLEDIAEVIVG